MPSTIKGEVISPLLCLYALIIYSVQFMCLLFKKGSEVYQELSTELFKRVYLCQETSSMSVLNGEKHHAEVLQSRYIAIVYMRTIN